jgi:hypothetical protein
VAQDYWSLITVIIYTHSCWLHAADNSYKNLDLLCFLRKDPFMWVGRVLLVQLSGLKTNICWLVKRYPGFKIMNSITGSHACYHLVFPNRTRFVNSIS